MMEREVAIAQKVGMEMCVHRTRVVHVRQLCVASCMHNVFHNAAWNKFRDKYQPFGPRDQCEYAQLRFRAPRH